jgi:hypothetical protein
MAPGALFNMIAARQHRWRVRLRLHRRAVQIYQSTVEKYGIADERAQSALHLVEITNPGDAEVAVQTRNVKVATDR